MCPSCVTKGSIVSMDSFLQYHYYIKANQAAIHLQIGIPEERQTGSGGRTDMLPLLRGLESFNQDGELSILQRTWQRVYTGQHSRGHRNSSHLAASNPYISPPCDPLSPL